MKARWIAILTALLIASGTFAQSRVELRLYPRGIIAGQSVRVTCKVPRHPDNRRLAMVVEHYRASERDLDGDRAPITYEFHVDHVPCASSNVACVVMTGTRDVFTAAQPLIVLGCDQ